MSALRKLLPTEMGYYEAHLLRLDRVDRYLRFGGTVTDAVVEQHCLQLNWHDTIVIGDFYQGELRAAAELRSDGGLFPRRGEAAFSVERAFQGQGIGTTLMRRVLTIAANRGLLIIDVICLLENRRMQALARHFAKEAVIDSGEVGVKICLDHPNHISFLLEAFDEGAGLMSAILDSFMPKTANISDLAARNAARPNANAAWPSANSVDARR